MNIRLRRNAIGILFLLASLGASPATLSSGTPSAPQLTPRQQDLLLQLSDAEANIQAINKALKVTGYNVGLAYDRIDSSQQGNDIMNRKGGGPVRWDEFYGKTAKDYPRSGFWDDRMDDHRPQQFAFVYQANNDQVARAKDQISSLLKDQQALLDRRRKHEDDQSRLWAILAWNDVEDREVQFRPIYRFALKPPGPEAAVLRPVILFLRTAASVAHDGLDSIQVDEGATFQSGNQRMDAAYVSLQQSLADALDAGDLKPEREKEGETLKALCKELAEQSKVIADDYANSLDRDKAKEDNSKLEFRGQLQSSISSFATEFGKLDESIGRTARDWSVAADRATPTTDTVMPPTATIAAQVKPRASTPAPESAAVPPPQSRAAAASHTRVQVVKAEYGSGKRLVPVANLIQASLDADPFAPISVTNRSMGGDPAPNVHKMLVVSYRIENTTVAMQVKDGEVFLLPPIPPSGVADAGASSSFKIIAARYGVDNEWFDVTDGILKTITDTSQSFKVVNMASGRDLHFGVTKHLVVYFEIHGRRYARIAALGDSLTLIPN